MSARGEAALEYAARGFHVFPLHHPTVTGTAPVCSCGNAKCHRVGKHPRTANGFHEATTDPTVIAAWWRKWPDANIGCVPGRSGHLVVDVDGPEAAALFATLGPITATREAQTGREGGRHRWYLHPGGTIGNGTLGKGLDIRANAGYVLLPPSLHATGKTYQWLDERTAFATLPAAVAATLRATKGTAAAADVPQAELRGTLDDVRRWVQAIPNTAETDRKFYIALGYALHGALPDQLTEAREIWEEWCEGWPGQQDAEKQDSDWRGMRGPFRTGADDLRRWAEKHDPVLKAARLTDVFSAEEAPVGAPSSVSTLSVPAKPIAEIPLLGWKDLGNVSEASWMVDGVFQRDSVTSLWGASRAFKSFLAIHLGLHVATGRPWFSRATQQGAVVYLVGEGVTGFQKRAYAAADALGIADPDFAVVPRAYDLTDPKLVGALCACLAPLHPTLIVVDTYFRYAPGRDHNKQVDHSLMMAGLDRLRMEFGATVLILDHGTKDPDDHRGPGGTVHKFAGYDTILMLEREGDSLQSTLTMQKQKDAEELPPLLISLARYHDSLVVESAGVIWEAEASKQVAEVGLQAGDDAALLALDTITLNDGEAMSWSQWRDATELSKPAFSRARKRLVDRRLVEKVGPKYRLTSLGREHLRQSRPDPLAVMGLTEDNAAAIEALLHDGVTA